MHTIIQSLPDELQLCVLLWLRASDLARAAQACHVWERHAIHAAQLLLLRADWPSRPSTSSCGPSLLRSLSSAEGMALRLGKQQPTWSWRDEWLPLCKEQDKMHRLKRRIETVEELLPRYDREVKWLCDSGWAREAAVTYTLLTYRCRGALGTALREVRQSHPQKLHILPVYVPAPAPAPAPAPVPGAHLWVCIVRLFSRSTAKGGRWVAL